MFVNYIYPTASEGSREVANLTERKNLNTPVYGVEDFVCLSVTIKESFERSANHHVQLILWNVFSHSEFVIVRQTRPEIICRD